MRLVSYKIKMVVLFCECIIFKIAIIEHKINVLVYFEDKLVMALKSRYMLVEDFLSENHILLRVMKHAPNKILKFYRQL